MLVGAVLRPERREDTELGQGRCAAKQAEDLVILELIEIVLAHHLRGDKALTGEGGGREQGRIDDVGGRHGLPAGVVMPAESVNPGALPLRLDGPS